jgi:hypothetical protein
VSLFLIATSNIYTLVLEDVDDFAEALDSVFNGKATILNRMRLACMFYEGSGEKKGKDGDGRCCDR